mmetsp:Transcript_53724/g.173490  ORF Transcript_53724/g.173490 Transcript_53724/m.173490 type:complete len:204 (+) Transcript_53724:145-756(+)
MRKQTMSAPSCEYMCANMSLLWVHTSASISKGPMANRHCATQVARPSRRCTPTMMYETFAEQLRHNLTGDLQPQPVLTCGLCRTGVGTGLALTILAPTSAAPRPAHHRRHDGKLSVDPVIWWRTRDHAALRKAVVNLMGAEDMRSDEHRRGSLQNRKASPEHGQLQQLKQCILAEGIEVGVALVLVPETSPQVRERNLPIAAV